MFEYLFSLVTSQNITGPTFTSIIIRCQWTTLLKSDTSRTIGLNVYSGTPQDLLILIQMRTNSGVVISKTYLLALTTHDRKLIGNNGVSESRNGVVEISLVGVVERSCRSSRRRSHSCTITCTRFGPLECLHWEDKE